LLCVSMLMGTTFAWFTDEVTSGINTIAAGNLDVELYHSNAAVTGEKVTSATELFKDVNGEEILWEPGVVSFENLQITNEGSLALAYQLSIATDNENHIVEPSGASYGLSQVLKVGVVAGGITATDRAGVVASVEDANWTTLSAFVREGKLLPEGEGTSETTWGIVIWWEPGQDDNRWNLNNGKVLDEGTELQIDLGVKLIATQEIHENDSCGNDYDGSAKEFFPAFVGGTASAPVTPDVNNQTSADVTLSDSKVSAVVPTGAQLEAGTTELTLTVNEKAATDSNVVLGDTESIRALDVHVAGIAATNTAPITVTLEEIAPVGLNMGNYKLYHVENGATNEMTLVAAADPFTAHNQFKYDPATGTIVLYMATFSEITVVAEPAAWKGGIDHSWYVGKTSPYSIANGDQLYSFAQIVGGMADLDGEEGADKNPITFADKTINLVADIDLNDGEESNKSWLFYPVGYYNSEYNYTRPSGETITSGLRNFEGTFDGKGHTISNFYQNTWEMKGDHDWYNAATEQYYRDGMGLFGRVYGGTVKNLTVNNFKSDGEITTTGCIAAYADGATFENISIFNCNPRVYNIGNGGIVGCVGWYAKEADLKTTFTNITVDNSNKISALWGSYDVACGGIVGQYYPTSGQTSAGTPKNAGIDLVNCHVAAQMDVYNDVCANYQYYAYRYAGMLIGSIRENMQGDGSDLYPDTGRVYPKMDGITASGCTVHYDTWNDYFYCELVDNTTASYTHDHQMSRLVRVAKVEGTIITPLEGEPFEVPATGRYNYVVTMENKEFATENATCYHFKDGEVWNHEQAGYHNGENGEKFIDENNDGVGDLKEDKQHLYLPFSQLFTGYGWGVTSRGIADYNGVDPTDIQVSESNQKDSVVKFNGKVTELATDMELKLGDIFTLNDTGVALKPSALTVSVTDLDDTDGTVTAEFVLDEENWEESTLKFTGTGTVTITIQDYYFCVPTSITVNVVDREPVEKFKVVMNNGDFLHRVGNVGTVKLEKLFAAVDANTKIGNNVAVTVEPVSGTAASGTYTPNATWTNGTIQFSGTGVVKVTITDNDYCIATEMFLEVVDATNITSATNATSGNVVLLNNLDNVSSLDISNGYTFYGNGFTLKFNGDGSYRSASVAYGFVTVNKGGTLDNAQIICKIFPQSYMFTKEMSAGSDGRYPYGYSAIVISDNSTISNCYVYGARNNIQIAAGNVTIQNTVVKCGSLSNIHINSSEGNTVTLDNVTTIQQIVEDGFGVGNKMLGFGILVGDNESTTYPTIKITGDLKQYNWASKEDAEEVSNKYAQQAINNAVSKTNYVHTLDGVAKINLGMVFLTANSPNIQDNRSATVKTQVPYVLDTVTISGYSGQVYSVQKGSQVTVDSRYDATVDGVIPYTPNAQNTIAPQVAHSGVNGSSLTINTAFDKEWITTFTADLDNITGGSYSFKFSDLIIKKYGKELSYTVKDASGNTVNKDVAIALNQLFTGEYTLVVTDNEIYNKNGELSGETVTHEMPFVLYATKTSIEPPKFTGIGSGVAGAIRLCSSAGGNWRPAYPALQGVSVTYWSASEGKTKTIDLATLTNSGTISGQKWTYTCDDFTLTITGGPVHTTTSYVLSPMLATRDGVDVLYFAGANKDNGTGTSARLICLEYVFTDKNASTTVGQCTEYKNGIATVQYADLPEYSWSSFQKGTVEEIGSGGGGGGCVTGDSMITLADGTQKRIDQVTREDQLLVWDFFKGEYAKVPATVVVNHGEDKWNVIRLKFEDGTMVKVVTAHAFFDIEANAFVLITPENVDQYVGHYFMKAANSGYEKVKLVAYEIAEEYTDSYSLVSAYHYNFIVENTVSLTNLVPDLLAGLEVGSDMKYNEAVLKADIAKYGLYTYADFADYISKETFDAFNAAYIKISVGKGYITYSEILDLISRFINN